MQIARIRTLVEELRLEAAAPAGAGVTVEIENFADIRATFGSDTVAQLRWDIERSLRGHVRGTDHFWWDGGVLTVQLAGHDAGTAAAVAHRLTCTLPTTLQLGGYLIELRIHTAAFTRRGR